MTALALRASMLCLAASVLLPQCCRAQNADYSHYVSPWKTPWDYSGARGAAHWSALDPDYAPCNSDQHQSPIDIRTTMKAALPELEFHYQSTPLRYVINNGHTIRVDYHEAPGTGSYLLIGGKRYQLTQFHFHRPSEEYLHGRPYPMVLHLMHKASDGEVVGVAVFLKPGAANATLARVWQYMPPHEGQLPADSAPLDPGGLLPQPNDGYYMYEGSQTAPPCTPVKWLLLKTPVEISAAQISSFAALYPRDVRPLQPLNGRVVQETN
jgi:carbonic anhydrase